jgi:hypothetical protein
LASFLSYTGGFAHLLATLALSKNPGELRSLKEALEAHCQRYRRSSKKGLGPEFVHLEQRLAGPGREFLKRVDLAIRHLPFYKRDVEAAVEWFRQVLDEAGGVEILLQCLSSGGHLVAQMLFHYLLARSITELMRMLLLSKESMYSSFGITSPPA